VLVSPAVVIDGALLEPAATVIMLPSNEPLALRETIVLAPLASEAVVLALAIVPLDMLLALMAVRADPLPEKEAPVIAPALNSPAVPLNTMVDAPLAVAAVVRAFAIVPVVILEAFKADKAEPLAVMMFAENDPLASLETIVLAPLADAAVVLALAIVPLEMLEALMAVRADPLPEIEVKVPVVPVITLPAKLPFASLATIVDAPLADAAVVLALSKVPEVTLLALIAVSATPLPDIDAAVIAPALNSPEVPRSTMVEAPLAVAAVVLALAIVPEAMFEALIAVSATPLPDMEVVVMALAVKFPDASRATIVLAPLASEAVVLALAIVPLDMFEALIAEIAEPLPDKAPLKVVAVIVLALKLPPASRATIVEAPLAEAAVVLALSIVPVVIAEALIAVIAEPLPEKEVPVIAPAANSPDAPRRTIVLAPLLEEAVVLAFAIVPEEMLEALIADPPDKSPITAAVTVLAEKLPPESR
jgi:hypothetical protein